MGVKIGVVVQTGYFSLHIDSAGDGSRGAGKVQLQERAASMNVAMIQSIGVLEAANDLTLVVDPDGVRERGVGHIDGHKLAACQLETMGLTTLVVVNADDDTRIVDAFAGRVHRPWNVERDEVADRLAGRRSISEDRHCEQACTA
jgi:hypothetical protein